VTNRILDRIPLKRKAMEIAANYRLADGLSLIVALGQVAPITDISTLITDASVQTGDQRDSHSERGRAHRRCILPMKETA
jgi:hypothetical protein